MLSLLIILLASVSFAWTGVWNGGGGLLVDGAPVTVGSALEKPKDKLQAAQIPGLALLVNSIHSLNLPEEAKSEVLRAINPSAVRSYYKVSDSVYPDVREEMVTRYSRELGVSRDQVALFALTYTENHPSQKGERSVFLFPHFFALKKESEQAAVLFHEALWQLKSFATYQEVIRCEALMQKYLENPKSREAYFNFMTYFMKNFLANATQKAGT
ncbi:hypothetical protein DOE51_08230 [Bdellovibrio sp. NC01]|nr:hypothetical protein DOE51_08230 [Bdellovibrio sp. NC01]